MLLADSIAAIGNYSIQRAVNLTQMTAILLSTVRSFTRLALLNQAVLASFVQQLYLTAVRSLPVVLGVGFVLGLVAIHYILQIILDYLGQYNQLGEFLIPTILEEVAPLATILIIVLRSGTAVISETALMKINNELETLRVFGIKMSDYIYLPRIAAFAIAGPSLTILFCFTGLVGSFLVLGYFHNITFDNYLSELYHAIELRHILILLLKPFVMAIVVATAAIHRGLKVGTTVSTVPYTLSHGMLVIIGLVLLIEVVFAVLTAYLT